MDPAHGVFIFSQDGMEIPNHCRAGGRGQTRSESQKSERWFLRQHQRVVVGAGCLYPLGLLSLGFSSLGPAPPLSSPLIPLELCSGLNPLPTCPAVPGSQHQVF